jgi:hypothetical protein
LDALAHLHPESILHGRAFPMTVNPRQFDPINRADIIVEDKDGQTVLIVELKGMNASGDLGVLQVLEYLKGSDALFGMFADFDEMAIFGKDYENPDSPILQLKTADVLSFYEPGFRDKRISEEYFATLIEAWLRDYAFHWRSEQPPAFEEMQAIGLAARLAGGTTRSEAVHADHPLH